MKGLQTVPNTGQCHSALVFAVSHSSKTRATIAREAGVNPRSMQRWLNGHSAPKATCWTNVITVCGFTPLACLIIAAHDSEETLSEVSINYIIKLIAEIATLAAAVEARGEITLDARAARRDAMIVSISWETTHQLQQKILSARFNRHGGIEED